MNHFIKKLILASIFIVFTIMLLSSKNVANENVTSERFQMLSNIVDPTKQDIKLFWKNSKNKNYGNFQSLKRKIEDDGKKLVFATNGGMYDENYKPKGLYIENGIVLSPIDRKDKGYGIGVRDLNSYNTIN